jgi:hypothetical protein
MKSYLKWILFLIIIILYSVSVPANAELQNTNKQYQIAKAGKVQKLSHNSLLHRPWISNGKKLGRWWIKNPKKYADNSQYHPLLYHLDLKYSYLEQRGNTDRERHKGNVNLVFRKNLFTSLTKYSVSNTNTTKHITESTIKISDEELRQEFHLALTDNLEGIVGGFWESTRRRYLQSRLVYYSELRWTVIDSRKLDLTLGGFYGKTKTSFMNTEITRRSWYRAFEGVSDYNSDILYFAQQLSWNVNKNINFSETANYMMFLEDTEYRLLKLEFDLDFKLTKSVSFVTSYNLNYDYNPFTKAVQDFFDERKAAGKKAGQIKTTDTAISIGVRIRF